MSPLSGKKKLKTDKPKEQKRPNGPGAAHAGKRPAVAELCGSGRFCVKIPGEASISNSF